MHSDHTRNICSAVRELYRRILKTHELIAAHRKNGAEFNIPDEEELILYIYLSAKRMQNKLIEYKTGAKPVDDESKHKRELLLIKQEYL